MSDIKTEILPCPFCGGDKGLSFSEGTTFRWGIAQCNTCGASTGEVRRTYPDDGEWHKDAIEEWNTRVPSQQAEITRLNAIIADMKQVGDIQQMIIDSEVTK